MKVTESLYLSRYDLVLRTFKVPFVSSEGTTCCGACTASLVVPEQMTSYRWRAVRLRRARAGKEGEGRVGEGRGEGQRMGGEGPAPAW